MLRLRELLYACLLFPMSIFGQEKLDESYQVSFGNSDAEIVVTEYFSFSCPQCIALFKQDFQSIKSKYLHHEGIRWDFHPMPVTEIDVWAMTCLSKLSNDEKRVFLDSLLNECEDADTFVACLLMKKAMEHFKKPNPQIGEMDYLSETQAFKDAFAFISQNEIDAVPSVEINGKLFEELPSREFIDKQLGGEIL